MDLNLEEHLPLEENLSKEEKMKVALTSTEINWIDTWSQFVDAILTDSKNNSLPGFPIWVDAWPVNKKIRREKDMPDWKRDFLDKNENFYIQHKKILDKWLKENDYLSDFPPSRRKFEWQAQDSKNLWSCIMHFRPSGIRAKKSTYVPALVAITQTSIVGKNKKSKRRLTVREGARLQGFPEWFNFYGQREAASFKQLGNAVNVGVIYQTMKALAIRDYELLEETPELLKSLSTAPNNPDLVLADPGNLVHSDESSLKKVRKPKLKLVN